MAISFDSSSPELAGQFANPIQSDTFSPPAGSTLVAWVKARFDSDIMTVSNTGTPLMWTKRASFARMAVYTAYNATAQSNIRVSFSTNGSGSDFLVLDVDVWNGVSSSNPVGKDTLGQVNSNFIEPWLYSSSVAGSRCTYFGEDFYANGPPDAGPGVEAEYYTSYDSSGLTAYKTTNTASPGTQCYAYFDAYGTGTASWRYIAIELLPSTTQTITLTGISSGEALGTPKLNLTVAPSGIPSEESFGTPSLALQNLIIVQGIESQEAFGTPSLVYDQTVAPDGITSAEIFGDLRVQLGYPQTVDASGIPSAEAFGYPQIALLHRIVFRPPSVQEAPMARNILHIRFGIHRGITVIKRHDGSFYETRYPDQTTVDESARVYWGGHVNEISVEDYLALTAAGYGPYLSVEAI